MPRCYDLLIIATNRVYSISQLLTLGPVDRSKSYIDSIETERAMLVRIAIIVLHAALVAVALP